MELGEAILNRRSIRKYRPDQVPGELIQQIIEAGAWAPSGKNRQLVEYIVVREESKRKRLATLFPHGPFLAQAPVNLLILCDKEKTRWFLQDGCAAAQNMLLKIHELGLGSCWLGPKDEAGVRQLLNIPENYEIITALAVGYPAEAPTKERNTPRIHAEKWSAENMPKTPHAEMK